MLDKIKKCFFGHFFFLMGGICYYNIGSFLSFYVFKNNGGRFLTADFFMYLIISIINIQLRWSFLDSWGQRWSFLDSWKGKGGRFLTAGKAKVVIS